MFIILTSIMSIEEVIFKEITSLFIRSAEKFGTLKWTWRSNSGSNMVPKNRQPYITIIFQNSMNMKLTFETIL
jgi:hypothetical protein